MKSDETVLETAANKELHEAVLKRATRFSGSVFVVEQLEIGRHDGSRAGRDVIRHSGGAAVVALDDQGRVLLVRQYRVAVGRCLLELPAGKLEPGEDPLLAAQRELAEETGYVAAHWQKLGAFYPSPGYLDEELHLFLATDLTAGKPHPDPGERLEVEYRSFREEHMRALAGRLVDAKTIIGLLLAASYWKDPGHAAHA